MAIKSQVVEQTIEAMLNAGYKANDITAIRTISNDILDSIEREGLATRKQTYMLSQDKIIKEVKRGMAKRLLGY